MYEFLNILDQYKLIVVIGGMLAAILCGCLKTPLKTYIKTKNLSEKEASQKLTVLCTIITAIVSAACVIFFRCFKAGSFEPFKTVDLYFEVVESVAFSRIAYALYEGYGPVSLKKWVHVLIEKILPQKKAEEAQQVLDKTFDILDGVTDILTNEIHLPLTEEQKKQLEERLNELSNGSK